MDQHGIAAGNKRYHGGRREILAADLVCVKMPLHVVHADKRYVKRPRRSLRKGHAHHERAHQTGRVGDSHSIKVAPCKRITSQVRAGKLKCLVTHAADSLGMLATGDFRDDAAKARMEINLRGNNIREQRAFAVHDGSGGLITRGFDGQNERALTRSAHLLRLVLGHQRHAGNGYGVVTLRRKRARGNRQRTAHDDGVLAVGVVARTLTQALVTQLNVKRLRAYVARTHLKRAGLRAQITRITRHASQQLTGNATATRLGDHGHLENLHVAVNHPAARVANKAGILRKRHGGVGLISRPPAAIGASQLIGHEVRAPRIAAHQLALKRGDSLHMRRVKRLVRHARGVSPRVGNGGIVHGHVLAIARRSVVCRLRKTQLLSLFRIGKTRVNRQRECWIVTRRIKGVALTRAPSGLESQQQARAGRRPELFIQQLTQRLENLPILPQRITQNE